MSWSRYTTVSSQRFASISLTSAAELRLSLRGAAGEEVVVTALKVKRGTPIQGGGGGLPRSYQVVVQPSHTIVSIYTNVPLQYMYIVLLVTSCSYQLDCELCLLFISGGL
jgi:hypothetical protein